MKSLDLIEWQFAVILVFEAQNNLFCIYYCENYNTSKSQTMSNKYDWLNKKNNRSVDNIHLWAENPRLNQDAEYSSTKDIAEEFVRENKEKEGLISLAKSIVSLGFIPADPIVIWQDSASNKYYVAEGNRRILILKLLRNPNLAPKSIQATILKLSKQIDRDSIKKILVAVAPSFEDAEWYISARHSTSNLQRRWETEQQLKWVMSLYDKYDGNIEVIQSKIDLSEPELKRVIRLFKLKSFITEDKALFSAEEYEMVTSMRFPITTFERFFSNSAVKEQWGLEFDEYGFELKYGKKSFLNAAVQLIKRMILDKDDPNKLDSRALGTSDLIEQTLEKLPKVNPMEEITDESSGGTVEDKDQKEDESNSEDKDPTPDPPKPKPKDDPKRDKLIHDTFYIHTDTYRIEALFNELKRVPMKWENLIAASIRIFVDLAVINYINRNELEKKLTSEYGKELREIILSKRLEFLKSKILVIRLKMY